MLFIFQGAAFPPIISLLVVVKDIGIFRSFCAYFGDIHVSLRKSCAESRRRRLSLALSIYSPFHCSPRLHLFIEHFPYEFMRISSEVLILRLSFRYRDFADFGFDILAWCRFRRRHHATILFSFWYSAASLYFICYFMKFHSLVTLDELPHRRLPHFLDSTSLMTLLRPLSAPHTRPLPPFTIISLKF